MNLLVLGLLLWSVVHLYPSVLPAQRQNLVNRIGENPYKGLFTLLIVASLAMIIFGWKGATPTSVYVPPAGLRQPAMLLVVIAFILFVGANFPSTRLKRVLRHPQLTGAALWSVAHLMANGDSRSVLLFSIIGLWSIVSMFTINRRDGAWDRPEPPVGWKQDIIIVVVGLIVSALAYRFHHYLSGIPLTA